MLIPFKKMPDYARVWIYQANRRINSAEEKNITALLETFCRQWVAHGQPLKSSFKIERGQFVIMAVDEDYQNPSGCSIDSSVGVMRQIQATTGVDFLDRSKISFYIDGQVALIPLTEVKANFASGRLQASTITFHTLAATKAELETNWHLPAEKSWMAKYLSKPALTA